MIPIDKKYNCEMMLKTGQYQTKEYQNKEDWWFVKYLKDKYKNLPDYEAMPLIREKWGEIYRTRFLDPIEADLYINSHFRKIYENTNNIVLGRSLKRITIYKEELDYINSLPMPKWFREFIFLFLGHCKTTGVYGYEYAPVKDYIKYLTLKTRNRDAITSTIYNKMRELGLWKSFTIKKTYQGLCGVEEDEDIQFDFAFPVVKSGTVVCECGTMFELINNLDIVTDKYKCDICGEEFVFGNRTQRTICEKCHKQKRRKLAADGMKKLRNTKC